MFPADDIRVIGFDADDTLWVNEPYYRESEKQFVEWISAYKVRGDISRALFRTEMENMELYGYGIKAFTLSLLECALKLTGERLAPETVSAILDMGKDMLQRPIELLEGIPEVLQALAPNHRLIVATKGDLLDQERKMERSGIADYFHHIEIMSDKQVFNYRKLLKHLDIAPRQFLMIGNSMKSDILPPLELGARTIHVPYHTTWAHEEVDVDPESDRFLRVESLADVLSVLV
ncbi:MAG: HAD family hydrolase [Bacteroidales bacterium]